MISNSDHQPVIAAVTGHIGGRNTGSGQA